MHIPSPRAKRRARIEIIPLIDIIFFLLATFMMVSLSMVKNQGLTVHLPVASSAPREDRSDIVTITITETGSYAWNKEATDLPGIIARLAEAKTTVPEPKIIINGDGQTRLQNVVALLDEVRKAGLAKVTIQTTPKS
jgi:biopolymer transport protein ExbD